MLSLARFSFGVGDRFGRQARAQLRAFQLLAQDGVNAVPVWNKSNREHVFTASQPQAVFESAKAAVDALAWTGEWHVDADHIRADTVDRFIPWSDFFTIDVADSIGNPPPPDQVDRFIERHPELIGTIEVAGIPRPFELTRKDVERIAGKYLLAVTEAAKTYRHIAAQEGEDAFIAEISMDETDQPQTPVELLMILAALADEGVRVQTIAPKFTGRFNKGVDYAGDLSQFAKEFEEDIAVIRHAVDRYRLPQNLKLSVHSGSDKFSLYPIIRQILQRTGAGIHLKTAGTTWLEELIGLAEAGGDGLAFVKEIYAQAVEHADELCRPYATVIDIDRTRLPEPRDLAGWSSDQLVNALRHVPDHPEFNPHLRQLLHIAFKLAAKTGPRYLRLLESHEAAVARNVTGNLHQRHLRPLFVG